MRWEQWGKPVSPPSSSSSSRSLAALAVLAVALAPACRDRGDELEANGDRIVPDTVRLSCGGGPALDPVERTPLTVAVERLLTAGGDLLIAAKGGNLHRFEPGRVDPVVLLRAGKDYDAREAALVRLEPDRLSLYRYEPGRGPIPLRSLTAGRHEASVALSDRSLFLHSPVGPSGDLVVERDRQSGDTIGAFLRVERNLLELLSAGRDRLLEDTGDVRALDEGFAFVPWVRDPIEIVGPREQKALFLAGGARGEIRTVSERRTRSAIPCPVCPRHQEIATHQQIRRLYAGAAAAGGALWILRLDPPGGVASTLLRYDPRRAGQPDVRSWALAGGMSPPRALTVWRETIVLADDHALRFYALPSTETGSPCAALGSAHVTVRRR